MRFRLRGRDTGWVEYSISAGGILQFNWVGGHVLWRGHATAQLYCTAFTKHKNSHYTEWLCPMIVAKTDAIMALGLPAIQHIMAGFRKRKTWKHAGARRYESVDNYLRSVWKHVLKRLGLSVNAEVYTNLTVKKLLASGVLKEIKEARDEEGR